jgi:cell division protein FtsB
MQRTSLGAELVVQARKLERKRAAIRKARKQLAELVEQERELQRQVALLVQAADMPPAGDGTEPLP